MKRNRYILLTLFCIIAIVLLQNFIPAKFSAKNELHPAFGKPGAVNNQNTQILAFFTTLFIFLLLVGTIHLILYFIKLFRKKTFLDFPSGQKTFPLNQENTAKLIFLITLFFLCTYMLEAIASFYKWNVDRMELVLTLNLILELGVIGIVNHNLRGKFLSFSLDKDGFGYLIKLYITILPLIIGLLLFNTFVVQKVGMKIASSPIINLFFALKDKKMLTLIILQIILFGPAAEELFFRAVIYKCSRKRYNFWFSAVSSSIIFSILHRTSQDILPLFFLGIIFCYVYEKTQNISAPIILHAMHNTFNLSFLMVLRTLAR